MAPAGPASDDDPPATDRENSGSAEVGFDEGALYVVIRKAVEDAVLGVIGTLLLVGIALVLVWIGVSMALSADTQTGVLPLVLGGGIALVGVYVAAATLEVIPPVREWF